LACCFGTCTAGYRWQGRSRDSRFIFETSTYNLLGVQILKETAEFDDFNELAKLFNIHDAPPVGLEESEDEANDEAVISDETEQKAATTA